MTLSDAMKQLREKGFTVSLNEGKVKISYPEESPPEDAKPLLNIIKANKEEAIRFLQKQSARELIEKQGWAVIQSETLGETVIWVKDGKVAIPARWQSNVKYTLDEVKALAADPKIDKEDLRRLHEVKKEFGGTFQNTEGFNWPGEDGDCE